MGSEKSLDMMLSQPEGQFIEYKRSVSSSINREMVAFANSGGGHILVGMDNDRKVVGVSNINSQISKLESIARGCDPPVPLKILDSAGVSSTGMSTEDVLVNLGVAKQHDERLLFTNTGVLFFAREPIRFLRHATVDCVLLAGTDKVDILDRKELKGNLMENVKQAMLFLKMHLPLKYEITGLKRKEILEIPEEVLREAVLNSVMHRDYHFESANISVEVYRDRVEIADPGGLPPGMKPEDLGKKSVRRNAMIADFFHRIGAVEKIGSGITRMKEMMVSSGLPEPRYEFTSFFTVIFDRRPQVTPQVTPQVRTMLAACAEPKSREEIQKILALVDRWHLRKAYILPALEAGWLAMTIPDKPRSSKQRYVITEKGKKMMEELGYGF